MLYIERLDLKYLDMMRKRHKLRIPLSMKTFPIVTAVQLCIVAMKTGKRVDEDQNMNMFMKADNIMATISGVVKRVFNIVLTGSG